jgi:hypothetical protein
MYTYEVVEKGLTKSEVNKNVNDLNREGNS